MTYSSSTEAIPDVATVPRHIAIIMDGNGRWATKRFLPRVAGHAKGVEAVRCVVEACVERGVEYLTLFAFSSENWRRPAEEVSLLMHLFVTALEREVAKNAREQHSPEGRRRPQPVRRQAAAVDRERRTSYRQQYAPDRHDLRKLWRSLGYHAGGS